MLESGDTIAWLTLHAAVAHDHAIAVLSWNQLDGLDRFLATVARYGSASGSFDICIYR
jgi:hypothetical protein